MTICFVKFIIISLGKRVLWSQSKSFRHPPSVNHDFEVTIYVWFCFSLIVSVCDFGRHKIRTNHEID